jgi:DNA topoisomerase-3
MAKVYIAEKPSVAKEIAAVLGSPVKRDGYLECANQVLVTWCRGHLLSQAKPEAYTGGRVRPSHLPVIPVKWELAPRDKDAGHQVGVIKKLLASASTVVNAGDADREGQLLVDEVLDYLGWKGRTDRLWLSSLDEASIRAALKAVKSNTEYETLFQSALARQRADWLVSLNGSYAMTRRQGALWPIGRVQTPTLALLVDRRREIEGFVRKDHYTVQAALGGPSGEIRALWMIPEDLTIEGLLLDRAPADALARKIPGQTATVASFSAKKGTRQAPMPYALSTLQRAANRRLGLSAAKTLEAAQELYEAKATTYPRTDCAYLPEEQHGEAARILKAIHGNAIPRGVDAARKHPAWNTAEVKAHYGIIPTGAGHALPAGVSSEARAVYAMICESYTALFMEPERFETREAIFVFPSGERFKATARIVESAGWTALSLKGDLPARDDKGESEDDGEDGVLPILRVGDKLPCKDASVIAKQTRPPKPYNDDTLIAALTGIHKFVKDPALKARLKETSGIGTEATRARIVENLIERGYADRHKKDIVATDRGCDLVDLLRRILPAFCDPGMTALQEDRLADIAAGKADATDFSRFVEEEARRVCAALLDGVQAPACPACAKGAVLKHMSKSGRPYWRCEDCNALFGDDDGKPGRPFGDKAAAGDAAPAATGPKCPKCPKCKKPVFKNQTKTGKDYYRCGTCKTAWWPDRDDPGRLGAKWEKR